METRTPSGLSYAAATAATIPVVIKSFATTSSQTFPSLFEPPTFWGKYSTPPIFNGGQVGQNTNQSGSKLDQSEPKGVQSGSVLNQKGSNKDPIDSKKSPDKGNPSSSSKDSSKAGASSSSGKAPVKGQKYKKTSKSQTPNKPPIATKPLKLINLSNKFDSLMETDDPISAKCIPKTPLIPVRPPP